MNAKTANLSSFKVLSLNMHKGFSVFNRRFVLHELREAVRSVSADVVFLQEVLGSHELHALRYTQWPAVPQYEFLADTLWKDYAYGRNAVYPRGHHGNAVLSKFPILRYSNHDISVSGHEKRGLLHCLLQLPAPQPQVHVICVHLALREAHRRQQFNLLCRHIANTVPAQAPLVVAGDFNDWRVRGHPLLAGCAALREAFVETLGRAARTFPARWPLLRLDRIYFRNLQVQAPAVHTRRPWSHLSDHSALYAEMLL